MSPVRICTASSSATATEECRGNVLISGSYGGEYNAWHAAKWGLRGVWGVSNRIEYEAPRDEIDRMFVVTPRKK